MEEFKSFGFVPEWRWWVARFTYRWRWNFKPLKKGTSKRGVVELRSLIGRLRRLNRFANHPVPKYPSGLGDENPMWHLLVGAPFQLRGKGGDQTKQNKQWTNERMNEWGEPTTTLLMSNLFALLVCIFGWKFKGRQVSWKPLWVTLTSNPHEFSTHTN
jgi:hypothetical protein